MFQEAFAGRDHLVCYAVKANSALAIFKLLAERGAGFDIVSGGELERVLAAAPMRRAVLCFPAWAKPPRRSTAPWKRTFSSSTWRAKRSWNCWRRGPAG